MQRKPEMVTLSRVQITEAKSRYKKVCEREKTYMDRKAKKGLGA